jgi:hypothetical protein
VLLDVLCRVAIEDDGHHSAEVLDCDGLSVERSGKGLCIGDDEHALGLACAFNLCISRCLSHRSLATRSASVSAMTSRYWRRQLGIAAETERSYE